MTTPLAFPIQVEEYADTLVTPGRVRFSRERFPRLKARRRFRLSYGPTTLSVLETDVLSVIRATKFTGETTVALPNLGTVSGHYVGDSIEYVYSSPTDVRLSIDFVGVPTL